MSNQLSPGARSAPVGGTPGTDGYLVPKPYAWYVFALLSALMFFDFLDRQVIASVFPFLKAEWQLTDAQCGMLLSAVNWSLTIFAIPIAILADRWSRTKMIGLMATAWSLVTIACAFTTNFAQLLVARFGIGVGEAGYSPAGQALISAYFPARIRSTLIGIFASVLAIVGGAAGIMLGGWIATHYGWRMALGVVAVPGLFIALLFFSVRDYETVKLTIKASQEHESAVVRQMDTRDMLRDILGKRSVVWLLLGYSTATFYVSLLGAWLPTYLVRVREMTVVDASQRAALIYVVSILGTLLGGAVADRLVARGVNLGRPLTAVLCQVITGAAFLAAFSVESPKLQLALMLLGGSMFMGYVGATLTSMLELVHPGLRATAISLSTVLANLLGHGFAPIAAGAMSDHYGIGWTMQVLSVVPLLTVGFYVMAMRHYGADMKSVQQVTPSLN